MKTEPEGLKFKYIILDKEGRCSGWMKDLDEAESSLVFRTNAEDYTLCELKPISFRVHRKVTFK